MKKKISKKPKPQYVKIIEKYIEDFRKDHKCDLCDGVGETECDNCGGIGWVPITIHEVELLLMKYRREQLVKQPTISGSLLLHDLFQVAAIKNEDGMPVIQYVDKPNGGSVAYVRHDAMVKKLNNLLNH